MSAIQSIYVALFGRPADPGGLAYWTEVTNNGADLSVMLDTLPSLPEYQARFAGMTNSEIVNSIYLALFGRDAEPDGLAISSICWPPAPRTLVISPSPSCRAPRARIRTRSTPRLRLRICSPPLSTRKRK
ncbi:MAG: hypothetical protein KIS86_08950 [Devosia sp.]|nr:hypothetical protein [Devosia sp.]